MKEFILRPSKYGSNKITDLDILHPINAHTIRMLSDTTFTSLLDDGIPAGTNPLTWHGIAGSQPTGEFIYARGKFTGVEISAGVIVCDDRVFFGGTSSTSTVYYVSTTGDDANDGLSDVTPWQSIQYAELNAPPGATIALERGNTWVETIALGITHGGTEGNHTIWDGDYWGAGAQAIIQASANRATPNASIVNIINCHYVTFQNITVDGNNKQTWGIVVGGDITAYFSPGNVQNDERHIIVQDCEITDCGDGTTYCNAVQVRCADSDVYDITIQRNTIDGCSSHGITFYPQIAQYIGGATPKAIIGGYIGYNTITNYHKYSGNTGNGIHIDWDSRDIIIEHNDIADVLGNGVACIALDSGAGGSIYFPTDIIMRYNNLSSAGADGIAAYGGGALTVDIYGNVITLTGTGLQRRGIDFHYDDPYDYTGAAINIYFNTIVANGTDNPSCLYDGTQQVGAVTFKNNIFYGDGENLIVYGTSLSEPIHSNNLYYKSGAGNWTKFLGVERDAANTLVWEPTAVITDPTFTTEFTNLHLQVGSPALDKGVPVSGIIIDIEGTTLSTPPNMGAYENTA